MKPILTYLKDFFISQRVLGDDSSLSGKMKADKALGALIEDKKIPGLAITVLREGVTVFQKGYGYADIEKQKRIDPLKTIFRIASVSKPIASTALAKMVAKGQIDLDTSFYDYVPYFPKKKYDFTIRQLAGHTAGIRGYRGKEYGLNKPYGIKESIAIFEDDDLLFKPGTAYHYNSFDWVLISLAMQEVSGIPFEDYVAKHVLEPLCLENTYAEVSGKNYPDRATFYSKNKLGFRTAIPVNNKYKLAGGGYLSTTTDIARLGQAYLNREIMKESVVADFLTSEKIKGEPTYYGLGWQVSEDKEGRPYYGHVGNGVGGYAVFYVYPELAMVFSILINCTDPKIQEELDDIVAMLITAIDESIV